MINTYSVFLYGYSVDSTNYYLDFDEGGGEITASIRPGRYSFTQLGVEIVRAMNEVGGQTYSIATNRANRTYTITATSNFSLLITSGSNAGVSVFSVAGFTGADVSGDNEYTSNNATGTFYYPQMRLQDFGDADDNSEFIQSTVNESANGSVEIYSIGQISRYEFNLKYINDHIQRDSSILRANSNALAEARAFLTFCITRAPLEFMADEDTLSSFDTIQLERTSRSQNGVGFRLTELLSQGLGGFYESGLLTFRRMT